VIDAIELHYIIIEIESGIYTKLQTVLFIN